MLKTRKKTLPVLRKKTKPKSAQSFWSAYVHFIVAHISAILMTKYNMRCFISKKEFYNSS